MIFTPNATLLDLLRTALDRTAKGGVLGVQCKTERDEAIESALRSNRAWQAKYDEACNAIGELRSELERCSQLAAEALEDLARYCEDAAHTHEALAGTSEREAGEAHVWNRAAEEACDRAATLRSPDAHEETEP